MKNLIVLLFPLLLFLPESSSAQVSTLTKHDFIKTLRVNNVGIPYGAPNDPLAAEVIVLFNNDNKAYGFQLRKDNDEISHMAMLNILRDAHINNIKIKMTYKIQNGSTKGEIIVVQLTK